ncbi:hypothetical protein DINM_005059 [Dirofilaria immitis]|nr:hypothetical protein [Dirofilaria immitis]
MTAEGFWLFDGLEEEPYGLLPLVNLSGKGGPTSTKFVERIGSYQWYLNDETPTIIMPGMPSESFFWAGGKLQQDHGVVIYDVNHLKIPTGSLDTAILAARHITAKANKPINFNDYNFITDAVNLQKLFAFAQEAGDGLFRIDVERIGKTVLLTRMEASDLMEIGHLVSYQFGQFKLLVRFEVDCADYAAVKMQRKRKRTGTKKEKFNENNAVSYMEYGEVPRNIPLQLLTTYPQGAGFPFFTWAQMFFTTADQEIVGWFKGNGDFGKPAMNALSDISKLIKPLPYVVLSKVHDCLDKIAKFLIKNDSEFKCALIWKGKNHLEIFAKTSTVGAVSPGVKELLKTQCKEPDELEE